MSEDVTQLLVDWSKGDQAALERLMPLVYDELHRLAKSYMRRERSDHTLQPTALVNEAYLRLIDQTRIHWRNRAHFFGVAAQLMRRVTLKHAERLSAAKRGKSAPKVPLEEAAIADFANDEDLLALNEALEHLEELDKRQARIVELRFYGGLTSTEIAENLDISRATVDREWRVARAWLKRELRAQT